MRDNPRARRASNPIMATKTIKGRGRLVPTRTTGITYEVSFGIPVIEETPKHGRGMRPARWTKCSVQFAHAGAIPDGSYFLYTDEGKVHQLKSIENEWHFLAMAA